MSQPKITKHKDGKITHHSVGALIEHEDKHLLIDRANPPLGFAGIAGHIDEGEDDLTALRREIKEESGLDLEDAELLYSEFLESNVCKRGVRGHDWKLYRCKVSGNIVENHEETKSIGWHSVEQIKELQLEPVWDYWMKKLGVI